MSTTANIQMELELSEEEALALAQFSKRVAWSAMRQCAVDEPECYQIRAAIDKLRSARAC
jgi:hypothetical protein